MSLINQMLRDLDKRRAIHDKDGGLPSDVRSLPPPKVSRLPLALRLIVLIALGGVAYYFVAKMPSFTDLAALTESAPVSAPELAAPESAPALASAPDAPVLDASVPPALEKDIDADIDAGVAADVASAVESIPPALVAAPSDPRTGEFPTPAVVSAVVPAAVSAEAPPLSLLPPSVVPAATPSVVAPLLPASSAVTPALSAAAVPTSATKDEPINNAEKSTAKMEAAKMEAAKMEAAKAAAVKMPEKPRPPKVAEKPSVAAAPKVPVAPIPPAALPKEKPAKNASASGGSASNSITKSESIAPPRERANAEYRRAISAANQGRAVDAISGLQRALRIDPLHSASRQLLVNLLLESQQNADAMQILHDGLAIEPAQITWAMSLARMEVDQGKLNDALQVLETSLPAAANNANYYGFIGHVQQRLKRYREAMASFQKATQLAPDDGRWWLGLGLAMEEEGLSTEAKQAFTQAQQTTNLSQELRTLLEQKLR